MSDPEDLQSDIKSGLDEWIYQLKRIGPPATCPKVPDVMRLNLGLTKIGRGQQNDFYLDSAVLKNFISRSHVEIFGKKNENGEIEYILTDKGLNGTFINDIRTHKTCVMEVGDKVTFGHTNGYKIQPGSYAEQPSSEFQFVFERVPKVNKTTEIIDNSHTPMEITDEVIRNDTPDLKNESTIVSDRLFLSDLKSNVQSKEKSSSKTRTSLKSRTRKDSSENSDLELSPLSTSKSSSHTKSSSVSNTKKRNSDTSVKSLPVVEPASSRRKSSIASSGDRFSETLKAQNDDDEDDDDNDDNDDDENENDKKDDDNDSSSSSSSEEEEEIVKPKIDNRKKRGRKPNVQKKTPVKRKITAPSDSEDSSEEDEASKPEADQKPKSQSSVRQKQAATAAATKKKKTGNDAPAIGSRKRRRKGAGATATSSTSGGGSGQNRPTTSDDLEPGVEWYEDDRCEAPDCKRPKKKRTPWVQCDDCDAWYHTVCVGANYNKIKDSDEHFNCGCE